MQVSGQDASCPALLRRATIVTALLALTGLPAAAQEDLPRLTLDPAGTTVSGISSGAYMAGQMHLAHSDRIAGAALIAGGPYLCAKGSLLTALTECMDSDVGGPQVLPLIAAARDLARTGDIAALDGLPGDRVYLFTGTKDETVTSAVTLAARDFYLEAGVAAEDIRLRDDLPAGHGFVTPRGAIACADTGPPFLNDCDGFDSAGEALSWLLGDLPAPGTPALDSLITFSQRPYLSDIGDHGLAERGFVYIPQRCREGETCRLHVAFHGCQQGIDRLGDVFARTAGYNRWAEAAGLVVLYPQATASLAELNPNGCWDWWGYDDPDYATRHGPQVLAVARMAERLGVDLNGPAPVCVSHDAWNWEHLAEGRATACTLFEPCANGSGTPLGPYFGASLLFEARDGSFHTEACPP